MRVKTMFIIFITVLLTVVIMQNTSQIPFTFLFASFYISKLVLMLSVALIAFIAGILVGRSRRRKFIPQQGEDADYVKKEPDSLSDEDRDYIS